VKPERIRVTDDEPLRRRRLAVLFRVLLFIPPYAVLAAWTVVALGIVVLAWFALLATGRCPLVLHRYLAAYLRYTGQATAWLFLLSGTYPNPLRVRAHPFEVSVPDPGRQPRLVTLLRAVLAIPALVLAGALRVVLMLSSIPAWFAGLVLGRTTPGLNELGTFCLRYELETIGYVLLLSWRYPRLAPG
jgi:Domain of unknown function (DUF4389)